MHPNEEATLVAKAKRDPEAFGVLYDRYVDRIYRYLLSRTGSVPLAQDLTAETFLAALKGLWRYRWTGKPFSAWLYRIAIAQLGSHYRHEHSVALELAEQLPDLKVPALPLSADYPAVQGALRQLSLIQQHIITLRYFQDLSLREIAATVSLPVNTVKSHLHRALHKLKTLLEDNPYGTSRPAIARTPAAANSSAAQP
ncbi:MAG: RNA polymerase sigma-70 factor, ECF subfamily [Parcubacteria group bacterium Gr01-1014_31]|nr:MAG: RNA polymerase sigma-70 factor, ECF subfamily [Parcubacteria group bacterium Gr01-1014_31]